MKQRIESAGWEILMEMAEIGLAMVRIGSTMIGVFSK